LIRKSNLAGKQPQAILFDFDGTLVHTFELAMECFNALAAQYKLTPITDFSAVRTLGTKEFLKAHGIGLWNLGKFVRAFQEQMKLRAERIELVPGWVEVLPQLHARKITLGILSSNAEEHIRERLTSHGVMHYFDFVSSYPKLFGKARMLKKLTKQYRWDKTGVYYVGDETRDMEAAKKAGVVAIGCTWGYQVQSLIESVGPAHILQTPGELLTLWPQDGTA
jgi:phosphoglycolate phosphatase